MPDDSPILMFNAVWFKPDGGAATYRDYMRAAFPIMQRHGGIKRTGGTPEKALIGNFDADLIFFVEWPSWAVFKSFLDDPDYKAIQHFREEAVANSLLVQCSPM